MAEKPKLVRGTINGATVQTSEENAARLGEQFQPEKAPTKKSASSKSEK
jgi:hypothetical protein